MIFMVKLNTDKLIMVHVAGSDGQRSKVKPGHIQNPIFFLLLKTLEPSGE